MITITKVAGNFAASSREAENMFPPNPRRMNESYLYNLQQQNSSRGIASAIKVPVGDATPSIMPLMYKPFFSRKTAHNQLMHFLDNNDESNSPTLPDDITRTVESMVSFSQIMWFI